MTSTATNTADDELLPIGEIKKIAGIGKTMIYRLERQGSFPKRYKPGGYASRWSRLEVMKWREDQREAQTS
ncbi:helix-turn-helix transcriptional regulator [Sphingomonas aquatilis]